MKKAFSTLGCPMWNFKEILVSAKDIGMDGVEIRGLGYQMYAPKLNIFSDENIDSTKEMLKKINIEISMLTSGCDLSEDDFDAVKKEAEDYIRLADKLGCKYVRIMCENTPIQKKELNLTVLAERYAYICDFAERYKVLPLIETNSILANSKHMIEFLKLTNKKNAKVLWDTHHPFRFFSESPKETVDMIGEYIEYAHIKDSISENGKVVYKMLGYGDVPISSIIDSLKEIGYNGYISLEWVKRWCPQLEESGVVFPHYANYIDNLL